MEIPTARIADVPDPLPEAVTVLDVREPAEWEHGHIEGALHIPLGQLPSRLQELPVGGRLLVVCKIGGRSAQAVGFLQQQGIEAVNLDGGMTDWADAGRSMVSGNGGHPQVV